MCDFFKRSSVLFMSVALTVPAANATQVIRTDSFCDSVGSLKVAYLTCERSAQSGTLSAGEIANCSQIYYDLKDRGFDGSFARIRAWYESLAPIESNGPDSPVRLETAHEECG
jgi:hypothetical protein